MSINQKGFGAIAALITLVVVMAIGFSGWYVYQSKNKTTSTSPTSQNPAESKQLSPASNEQVSVKPPVTDKSSGIKGSVFCNELNSHTPCATKIGFQLERLSGCGSCEPDVIETDKDGHFSIALEAGDYEITPFSKPAYPYFIPELKNPYKVTAAQYLDVTINYHDGTR